MNLTNATDEKFMARALELAAAAAAGGEVPVGAVLVGPDGAVIAEGANAREANRDPLGHAELLAIAGASAALDRWRLSDCTLYVTLEPCVMCAGAIVQSRVGRVVYGAKDPKAGAVESLYSLLADPRLNHRPKITSGVLAVACGEILTKFFQAKRDLKRNEP